MIYIACPYSHPDPAVRRARFDAVTRLGAKLSREGKVVFSPLTHSHPMAEYGLPAGWDYWERADREFLAACSDMIVYCLPGWTDSVGVKAEIDYMLDAGRPIAFYLEEEI